MPRMSATWCRTSNPLPARIAAVPVRSRYAPGIRGRVAAAHGAARLDAVGPGRRDGNLSYWFHRDVDSRRAFAAAAARAQRPDAAAFVALANALAWIYDLLHD